MSRKSNYWDNAPLESFFATLKKEWVHREKYLTQKQATTSLFHYIEVFYNRKPRHSALCYLSPYDYE
jgi:putative transposase